MKKRYLLLIVFAISWKALAQDPSNEGNPTEQDTIETITSNDSNEEEECEEKCDKTEKKIQGCIARGTDTKNLTSEFLAYAPSLVLAIALIFILIKLQGFSLTDALSTDHDPSNKMPSASRLIAFLSGISALVFSYGLFTFYTVVYIKTGCFPEIEKLTNALIALGIGVVPYSINKVAGAIERR